MRKLMLGLALALAAGRAAAPTPEVSELTLTVVSKALIALAGHTLSDLAEHHRIDRAKRPTGAGKGVIYIQFNCK